MHELSGCAFSNVGITLRWINRVMFMSKIDISGFTQASQPNCTEAGKQKLLQFIIVGGGPTVSMSAYLSWHSYEYPAFYM